MFLAVRFFLYKKKSRTGLKSYNSSDWTLDTTHPSYDPNTGWAYAPSFTTPEGDWTPELPATVSTSPSSSTTPPAQKFIRRRRWVRLLRRRLDIPPLPFLQPDGQLYMLSAEGDLVPPDDMDEGVVLGNVKGEDYVSVARRLVGQSDPSGSGFEDDVGGLRRTVLKLERAVDALRSGVAGKSMMQNACSSTNLLQSMGILRGKRRARCC